MIEAAKRLFFFVGFVTLASALGSTLNVNGSAAQNSGARPDTSGVVFLPNDQVSQSFAKGATLYNGNPERNYRVHMFHRDAPGEVEVHTKDADILYVLEGSATLVTGGTIAGGKETAPGEIRVASMTGGVVRPVAKGDIIIIPANVTHWFKEVRQPITYLGVKVR